MYSKEKAIDFSVDTNHLTEVYIPPHTQDGNRTATDSHGITTTMSNDASETHSMYAIFVC